MAGVLLILIGLLARSEVASHRHGPMAVNARPPPSAAMRRCQPSPDAIWITNLELPDAPRWLIRDTGELCDPHTGKRVTLEGLHDPEIP